MTTATMTKKTTAITTAVSNCSWGGWGVLMDGDTKGQEMGLVMGMTTETTTLTGRGWWDWQHSKSEPCDGRDCRGSKWTVGTTATGRGSGCGTHETCPNDLYRTEWSGRSSYMPMKCSSHENYILCPQHRFISVALIYLIFKPCMQAI